MTCADSAGRTVNMIYLWALFGTEPQTCSSEPTRLELPALYISDPSHPNSHAVHVSFTEGAEPKASIRRKGRESLLDLKVMVTMISLSFRYFPYEEICVCFWFTDLVELEEFLVFVWLLRKQREIIGKWKLLLLLFWWNRHLIFQCAYNRVFAGFFFIFLFLINYKLDWIIMKMFLLFRGIIFHQLCDLMEIVYLLSNIWFSGMVNFVNIRDI